MNINDEYHPHYPSIDRDHFQRLCSGAPGAANPLRLFFARYTPEQERAVWEQWQAAKRNLRS